MKCLEVKANRNIKKNKSEQHFDRLKQMEKNKAVTTGDYWSSEATRNILVDNFILKISEKVRILKLKSY